MKEPYKIYIRSRPKAENQYKEICAFLIGLGATKESEGDFSIETDLADFTTKIWPTLKKAPSGQLHIAVRRTVHGGATIRPERLNLQLDRTESQESLEVQLQRLIQFP
jgi:hypothetical protein